MCVFFFLGGGGGWWWFVGGFYVGLLGGCWKVVWRFLSGLLVFFAGCYMLLCVLKGCAFDLVHSNAIPVDFAFMSGVFMHF